MRYRVDGVMIKDKTREKFLINNYPAVVTRLKIMAETNISERRLPQDGAIQFKYKGNECDFRVSFLPTKYGERVVLRLLKKEAIQLALDKLGFQKEDLFEKMIPLVKPTNVNKFSLGLGEWYIFAGWKK